MKTKIQNILSWQRIIAILGLSILALLSTMKPLGAQQVTQGYRTDQPIERGMIVRMKSDDNSKVEPVKSSDENFIYGVVVDPNDAPISLSSEESQVFVATSGRYEVLTSTQNGVIVAGDYIAVSSKDGIGMKADDTHLRVVGRALTSFDRTNTAGSAEVNGQTVEYGHVLSDISVLPNPLYKTQSSILPSFLTRTANSVGGKEVSSGKIYIGIIVIIATAIVTGSLIYGGTRSSITAIGRNPLAKAAVGKSLLKVVLTGVVIFLSGLAGVYLLLKL